MCSCLSSTLPCALVFLVSDIELKICSEKMTLPDNYIMFLAYLLLSIILFMPSPRFNGSPTSGRAISQQHPAVQKLYGLLFYLAGYITWPYTTSVYQVMWPQQGYGIYTFEIKPSHWSISPPHGIIYKRGQGTDRKSVV